MANPLKTLQTHINPKTWASWKPQGLGEVKPHHLYETLKVAWDNKDELKYAWDILNKGVCDGCALGTTGMKDFTMDGIHLCTVRLNLLRLNTMPALPKEALDDVEALRQLDSKALRDLGRLPFPVMRFRGEKGFKRVSWEQVMHYLAKKVQVTDPERMAFFLTSRGLLNETYYVAQKAARLMGTNHVDNAARICHSPSTTALKSTVGEAASTCSYKDWLGTDLILLIGSNIANNQPVTTKYLYYAKQQGTRIVVINPYKEPGLTRYWVPSVPESALFGTLLMDEFFQVHTGGDLAFFNGVLKVLLERGAIDQAFIEEQTTGIEDLKAHLQHQQWEDLERFSGAPRSEMERLADLLAEAKSAVFVWSMGITQHQHGVDNVKAIVNLALSQGFVGKPFSGLMPIRGHSGVQGGGEMKCTPDPLPPHFAEQWGFDTPSFQGLMAGSMLDAAAEKALDFFYCVGGNFLETMPDPTGIQKALENIPVRVHQDIFLSSQMLVDAEECTILLPTTTRYEMPGGGCETTTERQVIFSPEIEGPRIAEARTEWQVMQELAQRAKPEQAHLLNFENSQAIRNEMEQVFPDYAGVARLSAQGDHFQWGGRSLCVDRFRTPDAKAHFSVLNPPEQHLPEGALRLSTRRGKQFNSMVQKQKDPLTGAKRLDVLMAHADMSAREIAEGDAILVHSEYGDLSAYAKSATIVPGNLQVHWPEGNHLLPPDKRALSGVPDYNVVVYVKKQ